MEKSMPNCYACAKQITLEISTKEHIILNAIGGRLKSKKLICKICNSKMGSLFDTELAKQLNVFANFFNIEREEGEVQRVKATDPETGEEYWLEPGGKPSMTRPLIEETEKDGVVTLSVKANDERSLREVLKGKKRKHKGLDIEQAVLSSEKSQQYLDHQLRFTSTFGGPLAFRSVCKTAVNFFLHSGGALRHVSHLVDYIMEDKGEGPVWFYFPPQDVIVNRGPKEVLHTIVIKGSPKEKLLAAYVEFFNAVRFVVVLNNNYQGGSFNKSYSFDVQHRKVVRRKYDFAPTSKELNDLLTNKPGLMTEFQREMDNVIGLALEKQHSDHHGKLIDRAMDRSLRRYPEGTTITQEMINEFVSELMEEIQPLIINSVKRQNALV
jgi:hypothetical protein